MNYGKTVLYFDGVFDGVNFHGLELLGVGLIILGMCIIGAALIQLGIRREQKREARLQAEREKEREDDVKVLVIYQKDADIEPAESDAADVEQAT